MRMYRQHLRREFLYRKSLEGKEREAYEHKVKVKEAIAGVFHHGLLSVT